MTEFHDLLAIDREEVVIELEYIEAID